MKFTIETPANNKKGWRKLFDCEFSSYEKAEAYGLKYLTDRHGAKMFRIVVTLNLREKEA